MKKTKTESFLDTLLDKIVLCCDKTANDVNSINYCHDLKIPNYLVDFCFDLNYFNMIKVLLGGF